VSQPLVSAWEAGHRTPTGPAAQLLEQLAAEVDVPTPAAPKRQREKLLRASLEHLAGEAGADDDLAILLRGYQSRMEAETDRLYREAVQRRERRPRLWAYLEQARNPPGSDAEDGVHRAAMAAFLRSDDVAASQMRAWYQRQADRVFEEARTDEERAWVEIVVLAVDAMWFLDLIGLRTFTSSEREAHVRAASRVAHRARSER
jgi:transcriptional regulator with XRE-family HTH domain